MREIWPTTRRAQAAFCILLLFSIFPPGFLPRSSSAQEFTASTIGGFGNITVIGVADNYNKGVVLNNTKN